MKKLKIVSLLLVAFLGTVVSCSKDEDQGSEKLQGKWYYDTVSHTLGGSTSEDYPANDLNCPDLNYLHFKAEGKVEFGSINPSKATTDPCMLKKILGTWSYSNNIVKVNLGNGVETHPIVSVSATKLVWRWVNPKDSGEYFTITFKK